MDRRVPRAAADVIETRPITLAGVETHPGWHALRKIAHRITTPLLPDDYTPPGQPAVVCPRTARARRWRCAGRRATPRPW